MRAQLALAITFMPLLAARALGAEEPARRDGAAPRLDVVFCVDTTGSMADEIEVVKEKMREMVAEIAVGEPRPDVRFGLVVYRDRGDEYVTKRYDLTGDIDAVVAQINEIVATGGNDYPESVNEALHVTVEEMNWDLAEDTGRLLFLIADAPPHMDYENDYSYREVCKQAATQGIVVNTIACSGLEGADQKVFEEIAHLAEGAAEQLTYMQEYARDDGATEVVVTAGGTSYAFADAGAAAEWREGAGVLARRGAAKELPKGEAAHPAGGMVAAMPGEPGARARGAAMGAPGAGAAGPAGPAGVSGEPAGALVGQSNNLDTLLTRQVQQQLARQGVRFTSQPYLPRQEWRGGTCGQRGRDAVVVRSADEWRRIWALVAEAEGQAEPPVVDFTRDMVLAAFGGEGWAGRTIRIADVWPEKDGLHARVERGDEAPDAHAPYHLILVSRFAGAIVWK